MGLFNNLMGKIFGKDAKPEAVGSQPEAHGSSGTAAAPVATSAASTPGAGVDVAAVLTALAAKTPEKLDWQHSIVDLMKLVGMDSSFSARKELAADLHYPGDSADSAAMNIWLHKEVMKKLSENGGKVPPELMG